MKNKKEVRTLEIDATELRTIRADGEAAKITGYAAVFNKLSENLGGFREKIKPGAFKDSIKDGDVRALWNHDSNFVLGRTKSGTLDLKEDNRGLLMTVTPPDTQWARDLLVSIERGDVTQQSFGFRTLDDKWEVKDDEDIRTLLKVDVFDVSPVTYPAYPDTTVATRSLDEWREDIKKKELESGTSDDEPDPNKPPKPTHREVNRIRRLSLLEKTQKTE